MKKLMFVIPAVMGMALSSCELNNAAAMYNYEQEAQNVKYTSEYAKTINKLERKEGNFDTYRRVVFYNVRLGETVFACEGYCHVKVDNDGDVELVIKVGKDEYLRHYLGQKADITYFSEQLKTNTVDDNYKYSITFNPKLWIPKINLE